MDPSVKLVYTTARMNAAMIIEFMKYQNFYDSLLEFKLELFIDHINKHLENEC